MSQKILNEFNVHFINLYETIFFLSIFNGWFFCN
jgi:hypothetical protein